MNPSVERLARRVRQARADDRRRRSKPRSATEMRALVREAKRRAREAQALRADLRHRTDPRSPERLAAIEAALAGLHEVAASLKQEGGRLPRDPRREERWGPELRAASAAVQRERRKLWKLKH